MRILFYTDTPNVGGAEKQMAILAKHLKSRGVLVSLAYGKYSALAEHLELLSDYDQTFVLNVAHKHDPRHYWELKRILEWGEIPRPPRTRGPRNDRGGGALNDKKQFDLVHIHLWNPGAGRYAFFAASGMGMPIVTTEHDPFELGGIKRWIKQACLRRTSHTIAISNGGREKMIRWYNLPAEKITVVHNGIEAGALTPCHSEQREESPSSSQIQVGSGGDSSPPAGALNDKVITCIAELHERKGHKYLLEAFEKLTFGQAGGQSAFPNLHLQLVGTGPLERELKSRYGSNPNIHFLGWRNDVLEILKHSDLLVLPSLREAFGLVVLEAMTNNVAVIATDCDGPRDIIEHGKTGLLVSPGNAAALAEAMRQLLADPEKKRMLQEAALKRVQDFTVERMAEETRRVYSSF